MGMDIESTFSLIGLFGPIQKLYFILFGIKDMWISGAIFQMVFTSLHPEYFICYDVNGKAFNNSCPGNDQRLCDRVEYFFDGGGSSIVSEWKLICNEAYKTRLSQSIYMAGVLCGAIVFGYMADVLGRVKTFTLTIFLTWLFSTSTAISTSFWTYTMLRFLCGMNIQGSGLASYVLFIESIGSSLRGTTASWMGLFSTFGMISTSAIAYMFRGWRTFVLVTSLWGLIFSFNFWYVAESPRWLLTSGYTKKAEEVMRWIAKNNKTESKLPKKWSLVLSKQNKNKNLDRLYIFFTRWILFRRTAIQLYSWFVSGAIYYGLTLAAGSLGDIYASNILLALAEIPAILLQVFFISKIGRKHLVIIFMICGGLSCFLIQFLPSGNDMYYARTTLALIGKLCVSGQVSALYIFSAELFPTSLRNGAMGMVSVASRAGGIICPFIVLLGDYIKDSHFTVFGVMAFTAGIANMWLPETNNCPLPDSINSILYQEINSKELHILVQFDDNSRNKDAILDTTKMLKD